MKSRAGAAALAVGIGIFLCGGCTPTNEDALQGSSKVVPHQEGTPDFKSYSEAMRHQAEQNAKNHPAKGAAKKAR